MRNNLIRLVEMAGGQSALALRLGGKVRQPHVFKWINSTKAGIPGEYVLSACAAIDFKITPHQLRPDLYPHPHDGLPDHLRQVA